MESNYKVIEANDCTYIERIDQDGKIWSIPMNEANADYQEYLKSLEINKK